MWLGSTALKPISEGGGDLAARRPWLTCGTLFGYPNREDLWQFC
jgi:hypothetical protein